MYFTENSSNLEGPEQLLLCSWSRIRSTGDRWGDLHQSLESSGGDATEDEEDEEISVGAQPSKLLDKGFGRWYIRQKSPLIRSGIRDIVHQTTVKAKRGF
jgi:hypothetical protein